MKEPSIIIECDFDVHAGKSEEAKSHRHRMHELASNIAGLEFGLEHCVDSSKVALRVRAQNEEAIRQMLLRIGPSLELLASHTTISRLECRGTISDALRKTLSGFDAVFSTS